MLCGSGLWKRGMACLQETTPPHWARWNGDMIPFRLTSTTSSSRSDSIPVWSDPMPVRLDSILVWSDSIIVWSDSIPDRSGSIPPISLQFLTDRFGVIQLRSSAHVELISEVLHQSLTLGVGPESGQPQLISHSPEAVSPRFK